MDFPVGNIRWCSLNIAELQNMKIMLSDLDCFGLDALHANDSAVFAKEDGPVTLRAALLSLCDYMIFLIQEKR